MPEPELTQHVLAAALQDNSTITERNEGMGDNGPKRTLPENLLNEMVEWQNKIDAVQLQFHLATKNAQDAMQPYMEHMKTELEHAKELWQELESASASGWQDRHARIIICFKFMRHSHEKTKHHFRRDENRKSVVGLTCKQRTDPRNGEQIRPFQGSATRGERTGVAH